jgi:succinoglycan biosynthesis transport protein ExoP
MLKDMATAHPVRGTSLAHDDEISLLNLLGALWRGKSIIVLCALSAVIIAIWYAFFASVPMYRSDAQMSLLVKVEAAIDIDAVLSGATPDRASINTEVEVIQSRGLLADLVDKLDLINDPEFNPTLRAPSLQAQLTEVVTNLLSLPIKNDALSDAAVHNMVISNLRDALSVAPQPNSYIFTISATTQGPEKSALIVNTLAQYYSDEQIAVKVDASEKAATWLADRVADLQAEIQQSENRINALRISSTLISAEAVDALNAQSVEVMAKQQAAELALLRANDRLNAFAAVADADYPTRAAVADDAQLLALVTGAVAGDANAKQRFDRRFNQQMLQRRGDVARAQEVATDLRQEANTINTRFEQQSQALINIEQTERDTVATRVLYETFLTRLKETTVQIGTYTAESRLLSEAISGVQVAPRRSLILTMAIVLGLFFGAAVVLIREALQNTFRNSSDLEYRTGRTVLGQIPRIPARTRPGTIAYLEGKPTSSVVEAIRNLRTSILMSSVDSPCKVIVSTSSVPGEGKTTLAIALALNLAGLDKRVLLIEGDIRRRKFPEYFPEANAHAGLLSVISGAATLSKAVWSHPNGKIDVLMGQQSDVNAADVLSSQGFTKLIGYLRDKYDYVIIDTPPVLVVPDARIISTLADAILYTVKWDSTTRHQVEEGLKQFSSVNVPVTGLVLSQVDAKGMRRYGYGDQHGSYSRYGKGYYNA